MSRDKAEKAGPEQAPAETAEAEAEAERSPEEAGAPDSPAPEQAGEAEAVARLEAEVAALNDRLLRALAECENVRRRAERDRQEAAEFGGTRLARDLLAVHDNLERALSHADDQAHETAGALIEGVELTRRELINAFAKHKIERFVPEPGERFDPHFQQAMYEAPVPGAKPGTVIEAIQAGFTISGRLLRPALVGVARAEEPAREGASPRAEPEQGDGTS